MSLNKFIASVKTEGLARTSRFSVVMSLPLGITRTNSFYQTQLEKVLLYCDTAQLPGINFSTTQSRTFGEYREIPYEKIHDPITLTFYVDNNMTVKAMFDAWLSFIINPESKRLNYYDNYVVPMDIYVEDMQNMQKYQCQLIEAYPKAVSSIALDYASKDIMKLSVTFAYRYFKSYGYFPMPREDKKVASPFPLIYYTDFSTFQGKFNDFNRTVQNNSVFRTQQNAVTEFGWGR